MLTVGIEDWPNHQPPTRRLTPRVRFARIGLDHQPPTRRLTPLLPWPLARADHQPPTRRLTGEAVLASVSGYHQPPTRRLTSSPTLAIFWFNHQPPTRRLTPSPDPCGRCRNHQPPTRRLTLTQTRISHTPQGFSRRKAILTSLVVKDRLIRHADGCQAGCEIRPSVSTHCIHQHFLKRAIPKDSCCQRRTWQTE